MTHFLIGLWIVLFLIGCWILAVWVGSLIATSLGGVL